MHIIVSKTLYKIRACSEEKIQNWLSVPTIYFYDCSLQAQVLVMLGFQFK